MGLIDVCMNGLSKIISIYFEDTWNYNGSLFCMNNKWILKVKELFILPSMDFADVKVIKSDNMKKVFRNPWNLFCLKLK